MRILLPGVLKHRPRCVASAVTALTPPDGTQRQGNLQFETHRKDAPRQLG
jgi:hypothetical protein